MLSTVTFGDQLVLARESIILLLLCSCVSLLQVLPTRLRRDCIVSCLRAQPQCVAAVFYRRRDVTQRACELFESNVDLPNQIRVVPAFDHSTELTTVFQLLGDCKKTKDPPADQLHSQDSAFRTNVRSLRQPKWDGWAGWNACDSQCGGGQQRRQRRCLNCVEPSSSVQRQARTCNTQPCDILNLAVQQAYGQQTQTVQAQWTQWSSWTQCQSAGGYGGGGTSESTRTRTCSSYSGCGAGSTFETRNCQAPQQSNWLEWQPWSQCSATCGQGYKSRSRQCSGQNCPGSASEQQQCDAGSCGQWQGWAAWTQCSVSCGLGSQTRSRSCSYGGSCVGQSTSQQQCSLQACPQWQNWGAWAQCSASCGQGRRQRSRNCDQGNQCFGQSIETEPCSVRDCGQWNQWTAWSACPARCGGTGSQTRSRTCTQIGECQGGSSESQGCQSTEECAEWTQWTGFSQCSSSCGAGNQMRTRQCQITSPVNNNVNSAASAYGAGNTNSGASTSFNSALAPGRCPGLSEESRGCDSGACPQWNAWDEWSQCSVSCGRGVQSRSRTCNQAYGCNGDIGETRDCDCGLCPVYGQWQAWTSCSVSCDYGSQSRTRNCDYLDLQRANWCPTRQAPAPATNQGSYGGTVSVPAPSQGGYGAPQPPPQPSYGPAPAISATSYDGGGYLRLRRQASYSATNGAFPAPAPTYPNPAPYSPAVSSYSIDAAPQSNYGGSNNDPFFGLQEVVQSSVSQQPQQESCNGKSVEYKPCNQGMCPVWLQWQGWAQCSVTCGTGSTQRSRQCSSAGLCVGQSTESMSCSQAVCCTWGQWQTWSQCSVSCGYGTRNRFRTSNGGGGGGNAGAYGGGGSQCDGPSNESGSCQGSSGATCQPAYVAPAPQTNYGGGASYPAPSSSYGGSSVPAPALPANNYGSSLPAPAPANNYPSVQGGYRNKA